MENKSSPYEILLGNSLAVSTLPEDKQELGGTGTSLMHIEDDEIEEIIKAARILPISTGGRKFDFQKIDAVKLDKIVLFLANTVGDEVDKPGDNVFVRTVFQILLPEGDINIYSQQFPEKKWFIEDSDGKWFIFTGDKDTLQHQFNSILKSKNLSKDIEKFKKDKELEEYEKSLSPEFESSGILQQEKIKDLSRKNIQTPKKYLIPTVFEISQRKKPLNDVNVEDITNIHILTHEDFGVNENEFLKLKNSIPETSLSVYDINFSQQQGNLGQYENKTSMLLAIPEKNTTDFENILLTYQGSKIKDTGRAKYLKDFFSTLSKEDIVKSNDMLIQFIPIGNEFFGRISSFIYSTIKTHLKKFC